MKKIAGILAALMLLTMLGGCYKSEVVMDFGLNGDVEVASTIVATKDTYEKLGMASVDDLYQTFSEESLNSYMESSGIKETGTRVDMVRIDENGNVLEEGVAWPEDDTMLGTRIVMRYDNLADAKKSFVLQQHSYNITPLYQDETGYGVEIEEKNTMFGTKYSASGKIGIKGSEIHQMYASQMGEISDDVYANITNSITLKFPLSFSKSNADAKGFLGQSLTWTSNADAPEKEVYFEVYTINPLVLGMAVVILILLIALIIVARKKRDNGPDAIFVDEEGNPIPVYDEEADDTEEGETAEEFEAVEVTEDAESDSEVTVVLDEVTEDAEPAAEDTEETDNQ